MTGISRAKFLILQTIVHIEGGDDIFAAHGTQVNPNAQTSDGCSQAIFHFDSQGFGGTGGVDHFAARVFEPQGDGNERRSGSRHFARVPDAFSGLRLS